MSSASGLHSLATIIKRLEAATSRIEDIASASGAQIVTPESLLRERGISTSASAPPPPPPPPPPSAPPAPAASAVVETPKSVVAFDEAVVQGKLKPFVELTKSFAGPNVIEMAGLVEKQFQTVREFILLAASCQKPDQNTMNELLKPVQASIDAIARAKEANRRDRDWFTHLTLISEGAPSAGWVAHPKPGPYVGDTKDSVDYYGNRVIKEFKEKDPKHVEWVRSFAAILEQTRKYIMEYHTTGLVWNPKGVSVEQYKSSAGTSGSGAPPPPPPPPAAPKASAAPAGGAAAVFAELNRGEEVTKGLRKVDKSEMTHKNPALRAGSVVPASTGPTTQSSATGKKPIKPSKPQALAGKKPSKFVLDGNKWLIEYQENESSLIVENVQLNQSINIFGCKNSTIIIKGKVNAVTIVNSTKTSVLVESVVSSVSVTSSPSFALQITGSAPMIQIDSTDSGQVYLSKDSLNAEITTAKCSAINVSLPVEGEEEGVYEEQAVPEMLKTVVKDGKLVTTIVEHAG
ncbi:cyclase-associated protein [Crucibulum laeve]|uniref:Adenylyl cyclase-associated protein n=1 Tax=Crucibulum laeve TaxID=68775 RepID=A0A5C3ME91_9AGAR|nr:cyclase-associated protein [Crucibulum laeve]